MKKHPLLGFFLLTFLITWGIGAIYLLFPAQLVALTSKDADRYHPLFVFAACAPTLSAFAVVLSLRGRQGLLLFWARYLDTGIRLRWYGVVFAAIVLLGFVTRSIQQWRGLPTPELPFGWWSFAPFAVYYVLADPGPLGEEGGWRGFALPLLQRRLSPLWASIVLGVAWSIWHLPAFYVSALVQSGFSFPLFLSATVGLSAFMTAVFNASRGALPLMIVIHWAYNLSGVLVALDGWYFVTNATAFAAAAVISWWLRPGPPVVDPIPSLASWHRAIA